MSTYRELRIREVLERTDDDELNKVKEIQRLCQDDRIRAVARREFPSTNAEITCARCLMLSLFMDTIMHEPVKHCQQKN